MEDEIDLKDYWFIIRKNLWLIALVFLIVFGATIAYTFYAKPTYESTSLVVVTDQDQTSILLGRALPRVDIQTQTEIVRSAAVMGIVHRELRGEYQIEVEALKNSNVISITAQSPSRTTAMAAANAVANAYINYTIMSKVQEALSVSSFITEQITVYEAELDYLSLAILDLESIERRGLDDELALQTLKQTLAAKEKLYNYLLSRREEVSITAKESASSVKIIQYGEVPFFPAKPNIPVNLALGVVLGVMFGVGAAFYREYAKNAYRNENEVNTDFGSILLGSVSKTKVTDLNREASIRSIFSSRYKGMSFADRMKEIKSQRFLSINFKKDSMFAEEIRKLRTNVKFYLADEKIKLVTITSPQKGDGKSTVAVNLALSLAQNESKVLLIDADLRDPSLETMFGKPSIRGLSDVILGEATIKDIIKETKQKGLDLITAGKSNAFPPELFGSHRMKRICDDLKRLPYDAIIFDAPSLEFAEASALAADTQGTLLVIGHDKTTRDAASVAKAALRKVNVTPFGVVMNWKR